MRTTLSIIFFFFFCTAYTQPPLKSRQIDSIVLRINTSNLPVLADTLVQNDPEMGFKMTTFTTVIIQEGKLLKYVNLVNRSMKIDGGTKQITSSNAFYYEDNKLIKIEEYFIENNKKKTADWYYADEKPLYHTVQSAKAADRAVQLLMISNGIKQQVIK
ncbi:hypothetical protein [Lacibacter sp.]|uniref:hypothetical protein n=1 Tax=Lacibacter sp. TaxID=1915409 RepID=UPI002B4B0FCC|nr:hypothetical protein [Lacibacter sp.]HLP39538.1 hypothetical protein [Lacibacter sp.]